jgi:nucleoside-diphosphate-sugar epimerase
MSGTALVLGATSATSKRLIELLIGTGWDVIGVSRHEPAHHQGLSYIRADLLDRENCARALRGCRGVTHVFYTARARHGEAIVESVEENTAMLLNALDAIEPVAHDLSHVHVAQGCRYYGQHIGAFPTPAREDDPRHMPPNYYFDQEDLLVERQRGQRWAWSTSRSDFVCDFAPERPRNMVSILAGYACVCAELRLPLYFPGPQSCFGALKQATDATQLARAMLFIATAPTGRNRAFNVTNGDLYRWERLWPRVAEFFRIPVGGARPISLTEWMADKEPVWRRVVNKHGLKPRALTELSHWPFGDVIWSQGFDVIASTTRLRQAGFHDTIDTEEMFLSYLGRYREERLLP